VRAVVSRPEEKVRLDIVLYKFEIGPQSSLWQIAHVVSPLLRLSVALSGITVLSSTAHIHIAFGISANLVLHIDVWIRHVNSSEFGSVPSQTFQLLVKIVHIVIVPHCLWLRLEDPADLILSPY